MFLKDVIYRCKFNSRRNILYKHQEVHSMDKYDLRLTKKFTRKIHLKSKDTVYRKQYKILEMLH